MRKTLVCSILLVVSLYSNAFCFDDQDTHPRITEKAIVNSNLDAYLKNNLGLPSGQRSMFPLNSNNTVIDLLKKGSTDEDGANGSNYEYLCRASNHFHNPLKTWDQSEQSDVPATITVCGKPYSNVRWATGYLAPAPDGDWRVTGNGMEWTMSRTYYLKALTESDKNKRETYFAKTFQAIGQVMHLLQDMAVPAHVRNDFKSHFYKRRDPSFVNKLKLSTYRANPFEDYIKDKGIGGSVMSIGDTTNATVTRFWDTDSYNGGTPSTSLSQGLSEYTDVIFLSKSILFAEGKDPSTEVI